MNSASAIDSTETFSECVVVYWSNSLSCSSGTITCRPPCIATASERTTASASASGIAPVVCTSCCIHWRVSTSSPKEKLIVAVGSASGPSSLSPFNPTAPKRILL